MECEDVAGVKRAAEDAQDGAPHAKLARVGDEHAAESAAPASGLEEAPGQTYGEAFALYEAPADTAPQDPLDTTAEEEVGHEWDAMAAAPVAAADGEEQSLLHQPESQAAEGEAAAVQLPDAPSADSGSPAAEPVVQEEETATMEPEEAVDDDATQRELEAVQQLQTDETLDGVSDPAGWQHNETNGDEAQGASHIAQTHARRERRVAAGASTDVKVDAPHDDAKSSASNAEEGTSTSWQLCAQEQDIKSQKPPGDAADSDASPGASSAEAQAQRGGVASTDSAGVGEYSAAAACSAAATKEGGGGGGDVNMGKGGNGEGGEGGTVVKEEGSGTVEGEGIVTVKAEVDAAGGAAEGADGAMMSVASIGALVNAGAQGGPPPRLPPPHSGVSSAMANAAGEGYVVRAPIPGSNKQELKKQLKETDALEYLNLVKVQFGDSPEIYNKFLDIMKDFKSHAIDTQKVIERVSKLFAGHQKLILGFNTFLPAGYKIEVRNPAMNKKAAAPEFDHAYSYVSKIKQRFSNQQDVYQRFLQILQRYKEEGFAIQQVKQQVAMLFKGHDDLLGEFSNFLPDPGAPSDKLPPTQKGGKKKGGVGGKGAVQTLSALLLAQGDLNSAQKDHLLQAFGNLGPDMAQQLAQQPSLLMQQPHLIQRIIQEQQEKAGGHGGGAGKGAQGEGKGKKGKKSGADAAASEVHKEAVLLEKLKKKLVVMGDHCYMDFLKCLGLYVQDVLTANELVTVLDDMMGAPDVREVFDELKLFLGIQKEKTKYRFNVPISEIDFANCPQSGISYRSLPRDYPLPTCTGRTELCHETLNDEWVSVPSGSEDFSYTNYRKNQYEESLFKCEDDRFELDMLIETNASTMRIMQSLLNEADKDKSRTQKLNLNPLKAVHLKAVERVYGDHGAEMVEHLKRAPRLAIGIVLPRLKHKDEEWRKARRDMNKIWRDVYKDNYYKSLDHRSFYFKQVDKKSLHPKHFLYEMRSSTLPPPAVAGGPQTLGAVHQCKQPCMTLPMDREDVHKDILLVLSKAAASELLEGAEARVGKFLSLFLHVLFNLKERSPEELKTSARAWSKRDRKADPDAPGAEKGEKRRGKGKGGGKDNGDKDNEDAMDADGGKEEQDSGTDKVDKGDGDDDKDKMDEDDEDGDEEEEEESDDNQDDLWQAVHAQSPHWQPLRCLRRGQGAAGSGAHGEQDAGGCEASDAGAARRDAGSEADGEDDWGLWKLKLSSGVKVFYGNFSCYVFFRLYEKLYQRLLNANQLAQQAQEAKEESKEDPADSEMNAADVEEAVMGAADDEDRDAGGKDKVAGETVYEQFMSMLLDLVEGHLDTSKFEDDCRMLLGTNSYELYTLEKLVEKLLAQVQHLTSDTSQQSASRLLALHEYEHVRASRESLDDLEAPHLAEYMRNAACLTGEEGCFGFYFDTETRALSIVLHDIKDSGKADKAEPKRERGLDDLLEAVEITKAAEDREKLPYLHRNIQSAARGAGASQHAARGGEEDAADVAERMCRGVEDASQLALKYSAARLAYCPHTTDLLHRVARCRVPAEFAAKERERRVIDWQELRLRDIPAEAEEERRRRKEEEEEEERRWKEDDDDEERGDEDEEEDDDDQAGEDRVEEAADDAMNVEGKGAEESGEDDAGDEEDGEVQGKSQQGRDEGTGASDEDRAASAGGKAAADSDNMDEDLIDAKLSTNEGSADDDKEDVKEESDTKARSKESGGKPSGRRGAAVGGVTGKGGGATGEAPGVEAGGGMGRRSGRTRR